MFSRYEHFIGVTDRGIVLKIPVVNKTAIKLEVVVIFRDESKYSYDT